MLPHVSEPRLTRFAKKGLEVPTLTSTFDTASDTYRQNRADQLAAVEALDQQLELVRAGGGSRYTERHRARGRLPVRERLELLLDPDSAFLELSPLAAWGAEFAAGDGVSAGDAVVELEAMKMEHTVRAPREGSIAEMRVKVGQAVEVDFVMAVMEE